MKIRSFQRHINFLVAIILMITLLISNTPQTAQAQDAAQPTEITYLIPIPLPDLDQAEIPTRLERDRAKEVTEGLLAKEADKILNSLRILRERGLVNDYEILPDSPVIRVTFAQENLQGVMQSLPGEVKTLVEEAEGLPACVSNDVEHFPDMVLAASRQQEWRESGEMASAQMLAAGAPVIQIYFHETTDYRDGSVWGTAAPKSEVQFRLLRNGQQVAVDYTWSETDGYYSFYPDYFSCVEEYSWELQAGDVVEISAGGFTASTTVTPINGWLDAETNTATGITAANQKVMVELYQVNQSDPCTSQIFTQTGTADGSGNFTINLSGKINFDRSAYAMVYAMDAAGNSTYYYADPYRLMVTSYGYYFLYLRPQTSFTMVLKRGEATLETVTNTTDVDSGYYGNTLSVAVQPGDKATLTYNGEQLTYTVVSDPSVSVDRATGQVSGSATAGSIIQTEISNNSYAVEPRCSYAGKCSGQTVPANGQFSFYVGTILNGEVLWVNFYTPEGEGFGYDFFEPSITAMPEYDEVDIRWWSTQDLTVTLKDSANTIIESHTFDESYWDSSFWVRFNANMVPGEIIEVTDSTNTRSMTVSDLVNVRANFNTDHVTGTVPAGHLVVTAYSEEFACVEKDHPGGVFDFFPGVNLLGNSSAEVILRGSDGHYTAAYGQTLTLDLSLNENVQYVFTEIPYATVNWIHKRGGVALVSGSTSGLYIISETEFIAGDVLEITTSDGNNATITFPEIAVELAPAERRAFGKAPANQPLELNIGLDIPGFYNYSDGIRATGWADAAGNFSLHFPPAYWQVDCTPFSLDGACLTLAVDTQLADGFWVSTYRWPQPAAPDAYEVDNSSLSATSYTAPQAHTLSNSNDRDWVKFTVSAEDAAGEVPYHLITFNTGLLMNLTLELFSSTDLITPLDYAWGRYDPMNGTKSPTLVYSFTQPGTYYLRISGDGGYCTSKYTLVILRDPKSIFLPLTRR